MDETQKFVILGRMSAMLAHEIRNPLAGISAVSQVLDGKMDRNDPRKKYVSLIMKEIDRVNKIVHDLLDYTRDSKPYFAVVEIPSLIDKVLAAHAPDIEKHGIQVERKYGADVINARVDQEKIERVFSNIIMNAIESMDDKGHLTVIASTASGNDRDGTEEVIVKFTDDGRGCELENLNDIFSPFFTTKTKGAGLGLAVSAKVMDEHNGSIRAERNSDRGMIITLTFPVEQEKTNRNK